MTSFVLCTRDKDNQADTFGISSGPVTWLAVPEGESLPRPSHKVTLSQWIEGVMQQAIPANGVPGEALDIVFFVYGYNTDPGEALKRQRLAERELRARGVKCLLVGFDWPTAGNPGAYLYDRAEAQQAAVSLIRGGIIPFAKYSAEKCPINVHVMAHSMGAFVVREAFRGVDKGRDADLANDWRIGQMVLFAGDLSSSCFDKDSPEMLSVFNHCGRLTNYFSGYDEALAVSNVKNIDISSRVGRVGMPTDNPGNAKALDVDCGPRYMKIQDRELNEIEGMVSHSWYLEDKVWYDDLAYTLAGKMDRNAIPTRTRAGENDFVLETGS